MTKNKKIGFALLIGPFCTLILVVILYSVAQFVIDAMMQAEIPETTINAVNSFNQLSATELAPATASSTAGKIINAILGLIGFLAVLGMFIGVPLGIYFLTRKEPEELASLAQNPKYQGLAPEQLQYIASWSWGAFFGSLVWALGNKLYLWSVPFIAQVVLSFASFGLTLAQVSPSIIFYVSLLSFPIGILSMVAWIYLSIKGRQLSWEQGWLSFDAFKTRQQMLVWVILAYIILVMGLSMLAMFFMISNIENLPLDEAMSKTECFNQCAVLSPTERASCITICNQLED
jgi:hypothetical protein